MTAATTKCVPSYVPEDCDYAFSSALEREGVTHPVTMGTLNYLAKLGGYEPPMATAAVAPPSLTRLSLELGRIGFSNEPPPPRSYVLDEILVASKACLLAGFGGVSKTQLLITLAVHVCLGRQFMGKATAAGAVLLLLGEEDSEEIARRVNAIINALRLTAEEIEIVDPRLRAFPMVGFDMRLTKGVQGSLERTGFTDEIIAAASQLEAEAGVPIRLIGLDHAGLLHGGEFNAREDVVQTMREVNHIGKATGASVVVLAHSPKAAASAEQSTSAAVAGSTAWVDHARGVLVMRPADAIEGRKFDIPPDERKDYVSVTVTKNNYGPSGDVYWLRRWAMPGYGVGMLSHVELHQPPKATPGSDSKLRKLLVELIRARQLTQTAVETFAGKDGPLGVSKAAIRAELTTMLADGVATLREPTDEEKSRLNIKGKTSGLLTIAEVKI